MKKIILQCFKEFPKAGLDKPRNKYEVKANVNHYADMLKLLPKNNNIVCLELGIGIGYLALSLKRVLGYRVYGIDHPSRNFLKNQNFKSFIKKEKFILKNTDIIKNKLPFKDNFFDVITFSEVIEHLEPKKLEFVFNEIKRVLKNNGLFLISTPNIKRFVNRFKKYKITDTLNQYEGTHGHIKEYFPKELANLLAKNGLKPVKIKMSNYSYLNPYIDAFNSFVCFFLPSLSNDIVILAKNFKKT